MSAHTSSNPSVEIILVKYNQPEIEANTVKAVLAHTEYEPYHLTVYQNKKGEALSKCWNKLIARSDADYICLLNTDTVPARGWLTTLMRTRNGEFGAVVPSSNSAHLSQIDVPFDRLETNWDVINGFASTLKEDKKYFILDTASAMCVVFPRWVWKKVTGFDERFFLYCEDTEFFNKIHNYPLPLYWNTGAYVHHYKGQSIAKSHKDGELDAIAEFDKSVVLCNKLTGIEIDYDFQQNDAVGVQVDSPPEETPDGVADPVPAADSPRPDVGSDTATDTGLVYFSKPGSPEEFYGPEEAAEDWG